MHFPPRRHDDLIDALSQALNYFRRGDPLEGFKALARAAALRERDQRWGQNPVAQNPVMIAYEQAAPVWKQFFQELSDLQDGPPNQGRILPSLVNLVEPPWKKR